MTAVTHQNELTAANVILYVFIGDLSHLNKVTIWLDPDLMDRFKLEGWVLKEGLNHALGGNKDQGGEKVGKKGSAACLRGTLTSVKAADGHIGSGRDCPCDLSAMGQSL